MRVALQMRFQGNRLRYPDPQYSPAATTTGGAVAFDTLSCAAPVQLAHM